MVSFSVSCSPLPRGDGAETQLLQVRISLLLVLAVPFPGAMALKRGAEYGDRLIGTLAVPFPGAMALKHPLLVCPFLSKSELAVPFPGAMALKLAQIV